MSIFSNFFKKEAPLLGLQGSGGGLGFLAPKGGAGPYAVEIKLWGGGGSASSRSGSSSSHAGGGGAFVKASFTAASGTVKLLLTPLLLALMH